MIGAINWRGRGQHEGIEGWDEAFGLFIMSKFSVLR